MINGPHNVWVERGGKLDPQEALLVQGYDAPQNRWLIEPIGREHDDG